MSVDQTTCEDLKAFERRLTEVISSMQPSARIWLLMLTTVSICSSVGAYCWFYDYSRENESILYSIYNHPVFALLIITLIILLAMGAYQRITAPATMAVRIRTILADFNMSCDNNGKLILKPRPTIH